jgi:hypothetical protein
MPANAMRQIRFLSLAAAVWIPFFVWLGAIVVLERSYNDTIFARIRARVRPPVYHLGDPIDFKSGSKAMLVGWSSAEPDYRWSASHHAGFVFALEDQRLPRTLRFTIKTGCSLGSQPVTLRVNDEAVGSATIDGAQEIAIPLPASTLRPARVNTLELVLPQARLAHNGDPRTLGICLVRAALGG